MESQQYIYIRVRLMLEACVLFLCDAVGEQLLMILKLQSMIFFPFLPRLPKSNMEMDMRTMRTTVTVMMKIWMVVMITTMVVLINSKN